MVPQLATSMSEDFRARRAKLGGEAAARKPEGESPHARSGVTSERSLAVSADRTFFDLGFAGPYGRVRLHFHLESR